MDNYSSFFINLRGKKCLVVGGGKIAARKIVSLLESEADVTCIAKEVLAGEISALCNDNKIKLAVREISLEDLNDVFVIIAATNDRCVNKKIYDYVKNKNILINSVDDTANSNFIFPAVLDRGVLKVAVSTTGHFPMLAGEIRNLIGSVLGEPIGQIVETLSVIRKKSYEKISDEKERNMYLKKAAALIHNHKNENLMDEIEKLRNEMEE